MQPDELLEFIQRRAGGALRVVTVYDQRTYETVYARDDIENSALQTRVRTVYRRLTADGGESGRDPLDALGEEKAMVQLREEAVILHFPAGEQRGVLVSLDAGVARDLHQFVVECLRYIGGDASTS